MGPNARVWRAFLDECEVFDADMVTEARDGLDLHLVFVHTFPLQDFHMFTLSLGWSILGGPHHVRCSDVPGALHQFSCALHVSPH